MVKPTDWRAFALGIPIALMLLVTACGGDDDAGGGSSGAPQPSGEASEELAGLEAAAVEEGQVMWYSTQDQPTIDAAIEAFETAYPDIDVESFRVTGAPMVQRFSSEAESGQMGADVLSITDSAFLLDARERGWLAPLTTDDVPPLASWPEDFKLDDTAVTFSVNPVVIGYNTTQVSDPEESWDFLLDDSLGDGKLLVVDPRNTTSWLSMMNVMLDDDRLGPDYFEQLREQHFRVVESAVPGTELLAAGEGAVLFPTTSTLIEALKEQGAPVDWFAPEDPGSAVELLLALPEGSPHANAGRLFASWLLTEDGQRAFNGAAQAASPIEATERPLPAGYVPPDVIAATENSSTIVDALDIG